MLVAPECPTAWQAYSVGDPIPGEAVRVSTWKDGTPLYMVSKFLGGVSRLGYLLPSANRTFIVYMGLNSPMNVSLLVYI